MMGTNAIYEYAATAMAPMYLLPSTRETRMEVGPSAAPMMPMEAASIRSKPNNAATVMVRNTPNWAAAPNSSNFGLESTGPKSIIAPMPIKSSSGMASEA